MTATSPVKKMQKVSFQKDRFYAIAFTDGWYPGRCTQVIDEKSAILDFLSPSGKYFKWPPKSDIQKVYNDGALAEICIEPVSNGRLWSVVDKLNVDELFKE